VLFLIRLVSSSFVFEIFLAMFVRFVSCCFIDVSEFDILCSARLGRAAFQFVYMRFVVVLCILVKMVAEFQSAAVVSPRVYLSVTQYYR